MKKKSTKASSKKTTKIQTRTYGWIKQPVDNRDLKYKGITKAVVLPEKVDLRPFCPPVYDQGTLGSCTAQAIGAAHQFEQLKQQDSTIITPSKLFIYYNERAMEGTINEDCGAIIRDGLKTVANEGVCPEPEWPYLISKFAKKPPQSCYDHALKHQVENYKALDCDLIQMKQCLAEGFPFVFGMLIYPNFESAAVAKTGIVPMPSGNPIGGHAVMAVGYDTEKKYFIIRNSWGISWGDKGYFYLPEAYITDFNLCSDFWTIRMVENEICCQPVPTPTPSPKLPWWKRLFAWLGF